MADEPLLAPEEPPAAPGPDPEDPPPPGAGACAEGSAGVETVGVRTGGTLGVGTGGGLGFGTDTLGTVGVGSVGVGSGVFGTVGVGSDGVETVGVGTDGVDTVGIETEGVESVGRVSAGLACGWIPTRRTATAARTMASAGLPASSARRLNRFRSRTRRPLQPPCMASYMYPLLMNFIRTQSDSTRASTYIEVR